MLVRTTFHVRLGRCRWAIVLLIRESYLMLLVLEKLETQTKIP